MATMAPQATKETKEESSYATKALTGSVIGYAMDGFDLLLLGFLLAAISLELHFTPAEAGSLVTWTLAGTVVGGLLFGHLSDHYGRVRVLTWTIVLFAVFTGLCAFATGYWDMVVYRTIAGLGLGGEFGIGMALVAEAWPASKRARVSSYVGLGWQAGVLLAALSVPLLLPIIGWRGMFVVGVAPAFVAFGVRMMLGEPEIFLKKVESAKKKTPLLLLWKDRATTKITLGLVIMCSVQAFGYYGVMIWLPSYLSTRFGFALTKSAIWTSVTILGMAIGIWIFGQLADRIGRRPTFFIYQIGAALSVVGYSQLTDPTALLIGGAVMGAFVNGMLGGYGTLMSELYPTEARATAQNVIWNLGRAIGGAGPFVIGAIASQYSFATGIGLLSVLYILQLITTALLIPERKGAALT